MEPETNEMGSNAEASEADRIREVEECERNGYNLSGVFLGDGKYARVYLATATPHKIRTSERLRAMQRDGQKLKVAIKIISAEKVKRSYLVKFLPREVSTQSINYGHPNVNKLLDFFVGARRAYVVLEYAENGDMLDYVNRCIVESARRQRGGLNEHRARIKFRQILTGLMHIHSNGVSHRDLKLENILLGEGSVPKISDFGFSVQPGEELSKTHCGSYPFVSPEVLAKKRYDSTASDIWSLGIMLFILLHGYLPYKGSNPKEVLEAMQSPLNIKKTASEEYVDLVMRILKMEPEERLTGEQILNHSWTRKFNQASASGTPELNMTLQPFELEQYRPNSLDRVDFVRELIEKSIDFTAIDDVTAAEKPQQSPASEIKQATENKCAPVTEQGAELSPIISVKEIDQVSVVEVVEERFDQEDTFEVVVSKKDRDSENSDPGDAQEENCSTYTVTQIIDNKEYQDYIANINNNQKSAHYTADKNNQESQKIEQNQTITDQESISTETEKTLIDKENTPIDEKNPLTCHESALVDHENSLTSQIGVYDFGNDNDNDKTLPVENSPKVKTIFVREYSPEKEKSPDIDQGKSNNTSTPAFVLGIRTNHLQSAHSSLPVIE